MRKVVTYLVTLAALVLDPALACHSDARFGIREVRAARAGTGAATVYGADGPRTVVFTLLPGRVEHASAGLVATAHACGHRDLVASAEACVDSTAVPLIVALADGTTSAGELSIRGLEFARGDLILTLAGHDVVASVSPTGEVGDVESAVAVTLVHTQ